MKKIRAVIALTYILASAAVFLAEALFVSAPAVALTRATVGSVTDTVAYNGAVRAASYGVFVSRAARISEVFVREGDYVRQGELLARVDVNDYTSEVFANAARESSPVSGVDLSDLYSGDVAGSILTAAGELAAGDYLSVTTASASVRAPHSGFIVDCAATAGSYAGILSPLFLISDFDDMSVRVQVAQERIGEIAVGQIASVSGSGFNKTYLGRVSEIAKQARQPLIGTGGATVEVDVSIFSPDETLMPGFSATARIRTGSRDNVVKLGLENIRQGDNGQEYVFVYVNGIAVKTDVKCRYSASGYAEITGLDANALIVAAPDDMVSDGRRVRLAKEWQQW